MGKQQIAQNQQNLNNSAQPRQQIIDKNENIIDNEVPIIHRRVTSIKSKTAGQQSANMNQSKKLS